VTRVTISTSTSLPSPSTTGGGVTGRPRDEAREQAILDAALALMAEVGVDRLTMDAVAARARSSKATIYRRWAGKHELVVDAMRHYAADALAEVDTGAVREDLLALLEDTRRKIGGFDGRLILGLAQASLVDPGLCRAIADQMGDVKNRLPHSIVRRAVARGELPVGADPHLFDEIGPAVMVMRLLSGQSLDDAFLHHLLDDLLLPALRHRPEHPDTEHLDTEHPDTEDPAATRPDTSQPPAPLPHPPRSTAR
jgi:AcrR family transcriptional regulator